MNSAPIPLRFDENGLVPAVIQDVETAAVLMIGFMNEEALARTRETGRIHYWSRSRAKLWKKGETSGHEQIVESIFVNCEQNSLLVQVHQVNAVCHDGYPTCFYRRLEDDNSLTVAADRWFDPATVYAAPDQPALNLEALTQRWVAAYEYLKAHDLSAVSSTSARLRSSDARTQTRIGDELNELAGVLDGSHRHGELIDDVVLEGSQALYWTVVTGVHAGIGWDRLRPDRALMASDDAFSSASIAKILRSEANGWIGHDDRLPLDARLHAVMMLVAQAAHSSGINPARLTQSDLAELHSKPYLAAFFAMISAGS